MSQRVQNVCLKISYIKNCRGNWGHRIITYFLCAESRIYSALTPLDENCQILHRANCFLQVENSKNKFFGTWWGSFLILSGNLGMYTNHRILQVDESCTDNPYFANCKLIVKARYCGNRYYAKFCCRSCTLAG